MIIWNGKWIEPLKRNEEEAKQRSKNDIGNNKRGKKRWSISSSVNIKWSLCVQGTKAGVFFFRNFYNYLRSEINWFLVVVIHFSTRIDLLNTPIRKNRWIVKKIIENETIDEQL